MVIERMKGRSWERNAGLEEIVEGKTRAGMDVGRIRGREGKLERRGGAEKGREGKAGSEETLKGKKSEGKKESEGE